MVEHFVQVIIATKKGDVSFNIKASEMRIVEQILDRLKVYSQDEITIRYF